MYKIVVVSTMIFTIVIIILLMRSKINIDDQIKQAPVIQNIKKDLDDANNDIQRIDTEVRNLSKDERCYIYRKKDGTIISDSPKDCSKKPWPVPKTP